MASTAGLTFTGASTLNNAASSDTTKDVKIISYLVGGSTDTDTGSTFITYDDTLGFRALNTANQFNTTVTAGNNIRLAAAQTGIGTTSINSLIIANTGSSTIADGATLTIDSGALLFSSAGTIAPAGTTGALDFGSNAGYITTAANGTISAKITGSAGLVKSGSGVLTLSGTNTFTGGLALNAGTVSVTTASLNNNTITVNGTATLVAASSTTTSGGITLNTGSNLFIQNANTTLTVNGVVTGSGALSVSKNASLAVTVNLLNSANDFTGAIFIGPSAITNINSQILTVNSLGDSANAITFGYGNTTNTTNSQTFAYTGASALTLNNRYFEFGPINTNAANGSGTIDASGSAGASLTINKDLVVSGIGGGFTKNLTLTGSNSDGNTFAGIIADGVGTPIRVIKAGAGTWVLSGANTYKGGTTISGGTLSVATIGNGGVASSNIGSATNAAANLVIGGGTLQYTGATASTDRNFTITAATTATFDITTNNLTLLGASTATTGALTKTGVGTLTLSGTNLYTGVTTVLGGTLIAGTNAPSGSGGAFGNATSAVVLGNTTGAVNASILTNGAFTVGRAITLRSGNTGVMTIGGDSADASIYSGAITLGTASSTAKNVTLVALSGGSADFQGVISENTSVPNSNVTIGDATHTGTVKLSQAANSYTGTTTITNGAILEVVKLANGGSNSSIGNSGSAVATGSAATDLVIDGSTLKYTGAGDSTNRLFTFTANGATIDASAAANAALNFTGTGSLVASGTGDRTLTLTGASTGANTMTSVIANPGTGATALTKSGAGTWVLSGATANTYSGLTTVSAGILELNKTAGVNAIASNVGLGGNDKVTDILVNGGALNWLASNQVSDNASINVTSGSVDFGSANETIYDFNNSGGNVNYGTGNVVILDPNWSGGTNTVNGNTTFGVLNVSGGTNSVTSLGTLTVGSTGGLNISGTASPNISVASGGKIVLAGNVTGTVTSGTASLSGTGQLDLGAATRTFTIDDGSAATDMTISTVITNGGLTKAGAGSLELTGTSSYTGNTTVSNGMLIVNGSISTSLSTTVQTGATISGDGFVGALTVNGNINPGNNGPGNLNTGAYTQLGLYSADIAGTIPATQYDQISVTGAVDITGGSLVTMFSGSGYAAGDLIFILTNDLSDAIAGTFTGFGQGATVTTYDNLAWKIYYDANSAGNTFNNGNDIALFAVAVPEPRTALLGALGLLALLRRRR